jgi:hypothetical protein
LRTASALISTWLALTGNQGVPVVKPACGEASHCTGVRALSRDFTASECSTSGIVSPAAIAPFAQFTDSMSR